MKGSDNMEKRKTAVIVENLNILVDFLAKRDLEKVTQAAMQEKYGIKQVDLLVLFGGCIPEGCEVFYRAYTDNFARNYMIAGGAGHTTDTLRCKMQPFLAGYDVKGKSEAEIMYEYLRQKYNMTDCILETKSTNCGNNVTNVLALEKQLGIKAKSIAFIQDATMQCRMEAGFRKYVKSDVKLINFAGYRAYFKEKNDDFVIEDNNLWGMWDKDRYIELLMGEIPRLKDDSEGYGPHGRNFIAHVDIPEKVENAFLYLQQHLSIKTRMANTLFATNK